LYTNIGTTREYGKTRRRELGKTFLVFVTPHLVVVVFPCLDVLGIALFEMEPQCWDKMSAGLDLPEIKVNLTIPVAIASSTECKDNMLCRLHVGLAIIDLLFPNI
jgi:hypothetical protein